MTGLYSKLTTAEDEFAVGSEIVCINDHQLHDKINYLARYIVQSVDSDGQGRYSVKIIPIGKMADNAVWVSTTRFMSAERFQRLQEVGHEPKEVTVGLDIVGERTQADKADAGKISSLIFDQDFLEANLIIAQVFEYGAQKYERESFYRIPFDDWEKAEGRHKRSRVRKQDFDDESGLLHLAHEAANKIVMLQLTVKKMLANGYILDGLCHFNPPPQDHKNG